MLISIVRGLFFNPTYMKFIFKALILLALSGSVCAQLNVSPFSVDSIKGCVRCLKMNGKMDLPKNNRAVAIRIYCKDSLIYIMQSYNKSGLFTYYLPFNYEYKVVLSKPGYYDKYFTVNTAYTRNRMMSKYELEFSTEMFKTVEDMNVEVLKKPLVEIEYNKVRNEFVYDPAYTQSINDEMAKFYASYAVQERMDNSAPGPSNPSSDSSRPSLKNK